MFGGSVFSGTGSCKDSWILVSEGNGMLRNLLKESKQRLFLAEMLPITQVLNDNKTTITKNSSLIQIIKIQGKNYSGVSQDEIIDLFNKRKAFFDLIGEDVSITVFSMRKKLDINQNHTDLGNQYANAIVKEHQKSFTNVYRTEIYIMVCLQTEQGLVTGLGIGSPRDVLEKEKLGLRRTTLENKVSEIVKFLDEYQPQVIMCNPLHANSITDFWAYLVNVGKSVKGVAHDNYLGKTLGISDIEFHQNTGNITVYDEQETRHAAILGINIYPHETYHQMLDMLMQIRHPFTIIQHIQPQNQEDVKGKISKQINTMGSLARSGISAFMDTRMSELDDLGNNIESGTIKVISHSLSILIYGNSEKDLEEGIAKIRAALAPSGISIIKEKMHLENAFWSQFPDNEGLNTPRRFMVNTHNVSDFINFSTSYEGLEKCAFGEDGVCLFKTREDTQFNFTFHATAANQAPGHTMLIGPTGKGKSVLAMFLVMNCLKYDNPDFGVPLKSLIFDSGQGLSIPTLAFDGSYINAGNPNNLPLNPMLLPDTQENRMFLQEWVAMLAGGTDSLDEYEKTLIAKGIAENYQLNSADRSITSLRTIFQQREEGKRNTLHDKLRRWMRDQNDASKFESTNAQFFNNDRDELKFNSRLVAFDMAQNLKNKEILAPLASYIFHAFNILIQEKPGPHLYFIDEMQQYLENEIFGPYIVKILRESRKKNGVFFGAIQEPSILVNTPNGQAVQENLATMLVMPQPRAKEEEYSRLGFTDREIDWIKTPNPRHEVLVKRTAGESVIINVDLTYIGKYLYLFSGKLDDVIKAKSLQKKHPEDWIERFLQSKAA
jgi:type IV secretion/conjugal transfer VirB4 family ATPase